MQARIVNYLILAICMVFGGSLKASEQELCEQLVDQSVALFKHEMRIQEGLISIGGGGNLNGGVNEVAVIFISYDSTTIAEARRVIITAHQRLIEILNTNAKLKRKCS